MAITAKHEQIDGLEFIVLLPSDNKHQTMYVPFDDIDDLLKKIDEIRSQRKFNEFKTKQLDKRLRD